MTKNKSELEEQELKNRLKKLEERIDTLEQTTTKPLYEYRSSILGNETTTKKSPHPGKWNKLGSILTHYILPLIAIGSLVGGIVLSLRTYPLTSYHAIIIISIAILLISIFLFVNAQLLRKNAPSWSFICFNGGIILITFLLYTLTITYKLIAPPVALAIVVLLAFIALIFLKAKSDNYLYLLFLLGFYAGISFIIISSTNLLIQSIAFLILGNALFALGLQYEMFPIRILAYTSWLYGIVAFVITNILKYFYASLNYNFQRLAFITWITFMTTSYIRAHKNQKKLLPLEQKIIPSALLLVTFIIPMYWIFIELLHFFGPLSALPFPFYALILYYIGIKNDNSLFRYTAYWIYALGVAIFAFYYKYYQLLHPYWIIELSVLFASFLIPLILIFIFKRKFHKLLNAQEYKLITNCASLGILFLLFCWGSSLIIMQFDQLQKSGSLFLRPFFEYSLKDSKLIRSAFTEYLLILYTSIFALISLFLGFRHKNRLFKLAGFFFIAWIILKFLGVIFNRFPGYPFLIIGIGILLSLAFTGYYWTKKNS